MLYAPHILQIRTIIPPDNDGLGRPIPGTGGETWRELCRCRCDDNTTKEFKSENGSVYRPAYHVVCTGMVDVETGDYVRCMDSDSVRGQGEIHTSKHTNYFNYTEIWI